MSSNASTGAFYTTNGQIIGPNGTPFVAAGIDVEEGNEPSASTLTAAFPGINFVRLAIYDYASPTTLATYVNSLIAKGIVVELEDHTNSTGVDGGGGQGTIFTGSELTNELNWYSAIATAFKSNPYVWFGTDNEPSETDSSGNNDPAALSAWQQQTYQAIRNTGNSSPIMVESNAWSPTQVNVGYTASDYASMTNIIWDVHYYGWVPNYSTNQTTVSQDLASDVAGAQAITSANGTVPILIGEYGNSTTGAAIDANGNQVITAVQQSGLGSAAWSWGTGGPGDGLSNSQNGLSSYGQQIAAGIAAAAAAAPPAATPAATVTPSANDTVVTGTTAAITDASGNTWTITSGGQVAVDGTTDTSTSGVIELAYVSGTVWQENTNDLWWGKTSRSASWSPGAGTSTSPLPAASVPSANDTVVIGTTAAITDASGNTWTITSGGQVATNGTTDTSTSGVIELAYVNGTVWQENTNDLWWGKTSPSASWTPGADPLPAASASIALDISEDAWQGDAQFTVTVDGTQVGGTMTASVLHSTGDSGIFVLPGSWSAGSHTVQISFINDAYGGTPTTDRNLYINAIGLSGTTESGTTATLLSNGTDSFTVGGTTPAATAPADLLTVNLAEDAWSGNAQFTLTIDGKQISTAQGVTALHSAGAWEALSYAGNFAAGSHTIGISFTNDAYGGSASTDRNLYINGITVNGTHYGSGVTTMLNNGTTNFTVNTTH